MSFINDSLRDIATYINTIGYGTFAGSPASLNSIYIGLMPDSPSSCITVLPAGGSLMDPPVRQRIKTFNVQILVRDPVYTQAETKAVNLHSLLNDNWVVLHTSLRGVLAPTSAPIMYRDEKNYVVFSLNYAITGQLT
jgi:hypothetical protein